MQTEHLTKKVDHLLEWKRANMLSPNPESQRGSVWTTPQKKRLVDSVMRGYPIPLIYLHHIRKGVAGAQRDDFEIIDGQQRIAALHEFMEGHFKLFDPIADEAAAQFPSFIKELPCRWAGKSFDELDKDEQIRFRDTKLSVVMIQIDAQNEARDLFIRLQAGLPLNAQEIRDAWHGNFTEYILKIGGKPEIARYPGNEFFNAVMKARKKNRGDYRQLAAQMFLLLMARRESGGAELCGIDRGNVDMFYYKHLNFDPQSAESQRFKDILEILTHRLSIAVGEGHLKKIVGHEAIHLMLLVDRLLDHDQQELAVNLSSALETFRLNVTQDRKARRGDFWVEYGQLTQTGSHAKDTIERRHKFFADKMLALLNPQPEDLPTQL